MDPASVSADLGATAVHEGEHGNGLSHGFRMTRFPQGAISQREPDDVDA